MSVYDDLAAGVAETTTVEDSAIALLDNLAATLQTAIADANTAQAKVQVVIDSLNTENTKLAADVIANTPQAPVTGSAPQSRKF